jgi:hypothetical protein
MANARARRRWPKWIGLTLLGLVCAVGALYALLFVRIVPPRSVRVVDAITGKPLPGMNVCLQVFSNSFTRQALLSDLQTTNSSGRALFFPSVINLLLLQRFDGYSMQVTDPTSAFVHTCGADVGFKSGPTMTEGADKFGDARRDGSEHFPVELVKPEALPKNIGWYPFMQGTDFQTSMSVKLVPVLPNPEGCKRIADLPLLEACTRLNTMAQNTLLQGLVPMYFGGMQRSAFQIFDGSPSQSRIFKALYEARSVPPQYLAVTIEQLPRGQNSTEHLNDVTSGIPGYDPNTVIDDEVVPGQKVKRFVSTQTTQAFWGSQNLVILITCLTPSRNDRMLIGAWLTLHPAHPIPAVSSSY